MRRTYTAKSLPSDDREGRDWAVDELAIDSGRESAAIVAWLKVHCQFAYFALCHNKFFCYNASALSPKSTSA